MGIISEEIEAGVLPTVDVFQVGHEFHVSGDPTVALAYALTDVLYVPCRLVTPTEADLARDYAPMANSL